MTNQLLQVAAIKNGCVIDHIPKGEVIGLVQTLKLTHFQLNIGTYLPSKRMIYKDLLKIHHAHLSENDINHIMIFAPDATINIIENYQIIKKIKTHLPKEIQSILSCPNSHCITHLEEIKTTFYVKQKKEDIYLQCRYCKKNFLKEEVK